MKSNIYFRHDVYTLDDSKIMALVFRFHELGYGVWWVVIERLTIASEHRLSIDDLTVQTQMKLFSAEPEKVREAIEFLVSIGLLSQAGDLVWSERILRQCSVMDAFSKSQSDKVKGRWEREKAKAEAKEKKKEESPSTSEAVSQLLESYHTVCKSLPKVRCITDARNAHCKTFLQFFKDDEILEGFRKAEASDFLRAGNGTWKGASFDWLINKNNFAKVLEGNYDNRTKKGSVCNDANEFQADANGGFAL